MKKIETGFEGLYVLEPRVFGDERGYFMETFNQNTMNELGLDYHFVQDNESYSKFGTVRGLHFQWGKHAQAKLVRAICGEVLDVVVDLRKEQPTFGKSFSALLTAENKKSVIIPRGFAHGFAVLSESAIFSYKCDGFYSPKHDGGVYFADPELRIDWKLKPEQMILSEKDKHHPPLRHLVDKL